MPVIANGVVRALSSVSDAFCGTTVARIVSPSTRETVSSSLRLRSKGISSVNMVLSPGVLVSRVRPNRRSEQRRSLCLLSWYSVPDRSDIRRHCSGIAMTPRFSNVRDEVSARMRLIKAKNTRPELQLFSILAAANLHFERHAVVDGVRVDALVDDRIAVFVDSPFWHLRDLELLDRLSEYWRSRLLTNRHRDKSQTRRLRAHGYSVVRFWADELEERKVLQRLRLAQRRRYNTFAAGGRSARTKRAD